MPAARIRGRGKIQAMNYWLLKTEPSDYSYTQLETDGSTVWDGVGNNLALIHMRDTREGDRAFIYHTGRERAIVGIARVTSDPYPDPRRDDPRYVVFDVEPDEKLDRPVTLKELKNDPAFADFDLVTNGRLSAMPVPTQLWRKILVMSAEDEG